MTIALDRKRLHREIEQERRAKVAQRVSQLGLQLKAARRARRESIERIRLQCRAARERLRTSCGARRERAHREGEEVIQARQREIREERYLDKLQRSGPKSAREPVGRLRNARREREAESDDEVRRNLSPDLASVFNKVRRHIKGSERRSRTEAFLEWVEQNPDEIYAMQEQRAAREIERLVKEYQRETRRTASDYEPF
jgi:hypothetical protein